MTTGRADRGASLIGPFHERLRQAEICEYLENSNANESETSSFCGSWAAALSLCFTAGCLLPCPHVRQTCEAIRGTVVARGGQPVTGARVAVVYSDRVRCQTVTDEQGVYAFPPRERMFWRLLIMPALTYSIPPDCHGFSHLQIEALPPIPR